MAIWKLKCCPRCRGDMFLSGDPDGWYEVCLQCSYRAELKNIDEFMQRPAQKEKRPTAVRRNMPYS